ncbi:SDR family NAD(P)-dependent oxidoreductase [Sphingomonas jatrophae]|uniref:NAD(P)-dependent dehydrogenase, short-chain alcohol dehydrogenase family n=1 Tax=Sphingomonas jatrophae TaxID=1166337 RepID=A0A1I6M166_9SPHN|nr:SDR family oxidoreductase [Sphingomonas jatrophae]SFS09457.1 NAD(P)-dependent dehydrogenase, short-chain alcohol dehydrogenase family [Sphingomonas jatrophae]
MGMFDGAVALVTGAGGGIGSATVEALLAQGAEVVATDLREPSAGTLRLAHDVSSEADWARIAAEIQERWGKLDCLVNNAGIATISAIEENSLDDWRRQMSVNVDSMLLSLKATLPLLKEAGKTREGGASVVNLSSTGGLTGAAFMSAYCTSKGAVTLFSKCAAIEFGVLGYNIRVNSMHPGGIGTGMLDEIFDAYVRLGVVTDKDEAGKGVVRDHPIGRLGRPEEIAAGIVHLCSPASSFMTGSAMVVDGGFTAH